MSRSIFCHNRYHLGDCLQILHLLRSLAKQNDQTPFVFFTNGCNLPQLREVVADLPNILLADFESPLWKEREHESIDTWKNVGATDTRQGEVQNYQRGFWETSPNRWNWSAFALEHHMLTCAKMRLPFPFTCREHLLLDYPALEPQGDEPEVDFLIGDSAPSSGQYSEWADHSKNPLQNLVIRFHMEGKSFLQTSGFQRGGSTISTIGRCSLKAKHHIMVGNAPFFTTLNVHNNHYSEGRKRIVLLDNGEQLNMPGIAQCANVAEVLAIARTEGWI